MAANLLQTLLSLGFVLALIFGLGWITRRLQKLRGVQGAELHIESGIQLGPKEKLVLVKVHGQEFLLGVAPGSVQLMHRFAPPAARTAEVIPFADHLKSRP